MNEIFLYREYAKIGENCKKYSTSVSYETLVGGTPTAGRAYKQTQCLSKGTANAPLDAVGTLTSQLCCSAKVVEKSLQTLLTFRLVKILSLTVVLSMGILSESWADTTCQDKGQESCGTNCCYSIDTTGKISFSQIDETATGIIADNALQNKGITGELVIPNWVTDIGDWAFQNNQITSVVVPESVQSAGEEPFINNNLTSATILGSFGNAPGALADNSNLQEVTITDEITSHSALFARIPENVTIRCLGSESMCAVALSPYMNASSCGGACLSNPIIVYGCGDKFTKEGYGCVAADNCGNGFKADSTTKQCVAISESDCYANEQVYWNNECMEEYPFSKKHWTPAEAAQYLKDTDNEIIMTFKVNR